MHEKLLQPKRSETCLRCCSALSTREMQKAELSEHLLGCIKNSLGNQRKYVIKYKGSEWLPEGSCYCCGGCCHSLCSTSPSTLDIITGQKRIIPTASWVTGICSVGCVICGHSNATEWLNWRGAFMWSAPIAASATTMFIPCQKSGKRLFSSAPSDSSCRG